MSYSTMDIDLENPKERALLLSRIIRGYEVMAQEREMVVDMCSFISKEQADIAELLKVADTDIDELSAVASATKCMEELSRQTKEISQLCAESQQLLHKVAEISGRCPPKRSGETVEQLIADVLQLRETTQANTDGV